MDTVSTKICNNNAYCNIEEERSVQAKTALTNSTVRGPV